MFKVLVPSEGEIAYLRAGEAFRDMTEKVTGETPELVYEPADGYDLVVIGSDSVNDFTAQAFAADFIDTFGIRYGTDDYALRSVESGGRQCLFLAGGCGRSTLYAVYDYFERCAGCHYYWDGDVIGHLDSLPLTGLNVVEKPRFTYRGLRYFAHRGLHRFQAEHWSLEDWKKEIDWMVKRRLNYFMLRIGMDDVYQRAFPETVDYPSAAERLPEAGSGYDDRTLFWPLEYRSMLRKQLLEYARERGLMHSEDFGTMTHWYCRTPIQYLEKKKPVLLDQSSSGYAEQTGLVWDPRVKENLDNYMKVTDVYAGYYGRPELFHTIGLAERFIFPRREDNMKIKLYTYRRILQRIREKYPMSKQLIAAWDFIGWWRPEEVQQLIGELDPEHQIILDYMCENDDPGPTFLNWNMVGKFPWIVGIFHAFECQNDIRGPYDTTRARLEVAKNDPFCKGMILWPELSHSDTLMLEYLARNSWQPDQLTIEPLADSFAHERYGIWGDRMNAVWQCYLPIVKLVQWGHFSRINPNDPEYERYCQFGWENRVFLMDMLGASVLRTNGKNERKRIRYLLDRVHEVAGRGEEVLRAVSELPDAAVEDPFIRRDAVDITQSLIGRLCHWTILKLVLERDAYLNGAENADSMLSRIEAIRQLSAVMAGVLSCHIDYSMYATLQGLKAVCPVNPVFEGTLKQNLVNGYCRQACYEPYRYLFIEEQDYYFRWFRKNLEAENRGEWNAECFQPEKDRMFRRFLEIPLRDMRPEKEGDIREFAGKAAEMLRNLNL